MFGSFMGKEFVLGLSVVVWIKEFFVCNFGSCMGTGICVWTFGSCMGKGICVWKFGSCMDKGICVWISVVLWIK